MKKKNYIVLYADELDCDVWKEYCDNCHVPYESTTITIWFRDDDVEYEEEE